MLEATSGDVEAETGSGGLDGAVSTARWSGRARRHFPWLPCPMFGGRSSGDQGPRSLKQIVGKERPSMAENRAGSVINVRADHPSNGSDNLAYSSLSRF